MLKSDNLLQILIEQMKVTDIYGSLLFQWSSNLSCFILKSRIQQFVFKTRLSLTAIFTILVFLQLLYTWKNINIFVKLHTMFMLCALLIHIYTRTVFLSKAQQIVSYLNGMLVFENRRKGKYFFL